MARRIPRRTRRSLLTQLSRLLTRRSKLLRRPQPRQRPRPLRKQRLQLLPLGRLPIRLSKQLVLLLLQSPRPAMQLTRQKTLPPMRLMQLVMLPTPRRTLLTTPKPLPRTPTRVIDRVCKLQKRRPPRAAVFLPAIPRVSVGSASRLSSLRAQAQSHAPPAHAPHSPIPASPSPQQ